MRLSYPYPSASRPATNARENISLSAETSKLLDPALTTAESARIETLCRPFEAVKRWNGPFRSPVPDAAQDLGLWARCARITAGPYGSFHRGQDLRGAVGTPVTVARGRRRRPLAEPLTVRGNTVILRHGLGRVQRLQPPERGRRQGGRHRHRRNPRLGKVGATGLVTGPHLHWEVRVLGVPVNPVQWVEGD